MRMRKSGYRSGLLSLDTDVDTTQGRQWGTPRETDGVQNHIQIAQKAWSSETEMVGVHCLLNMHTDMQNRQVPAWNSEMPFSGLPHA